MKQIGTADIKGKFAVAAPSVRVDTGIGIADHANFMNGEKVAVLRPVFPHGNLVRYRFKVCFCLNLEGIDRSRGIHQKIFVHKSNFRAVVQTENPLHTAQSIAGTLLRALFKPKAYLLFGILPGQHDFVLVKQRKG